MPSSRNKIKFQIWDRQIYNGGGSRLHGRQMYRTCHTAQRDEVRENFKLPISHFTEFEHIADFIVIFQSVDKSCLSNLTILNTRFLKLHVIYIHV